MNVIWVVRLGFDEAVEICRSSIIEQKPHSTGAAIKTRSGLIYSGDIARSDDQVVTLTGMVMIGKAVGPGVTESEAI